MRNIVLVFGLVVIAPLAAIAQSGDTPDFRTVVETMLRERYRAELSTVCAVDDLVEGRLFREYGAIFISNTGGLLPRRCILDGEEAVQAFQTSMKRDVAMIGGVQVTLQQAAMTALHAARQEAAAKGLAITPRGGQAASTRSYSKTVELWRSRFEPALRHWVAKGLIAKSDADSVRVAPIRNQVYGVLAWEKEGLWFSKDLSKSILYSVAVPGASQHNFMLALDVEQFANKQVREILAKHGWFQTVKSDLPHFTYLGIPEKDLQGRGLTPVIVSGQTFWIPNMK